MSWLLPEVVIHHKGRVRTVGEFAEKGVKRRERHRRWAMSPKGRAWLKAYEATPERRAMMKARRVRWLASEKGKAWMERTREQRNAYFRKLYHIGGPERRAYLNEKQRQYRAAKKGKHETRHAIR